MQIENSLLVGVIACCLATRAEWPALSEWDQRRYADIYEPTVVGVPPYNAACMWAVRPDGEIRHYGRMPVGGKIRRCYISSTNLGLDWRTVVVDDIDHDPFVGQVSPLSGRWLSSSCRSYAPSKIECKDFMNARPQILLSWRPRWVAPCVKYDRPTGRQWASVMLSDDDGKTWRMVTIEKNVSTEGRLIGGDKMPRWNNWCCEPTVAELPGRALLMICRTSFNHPVAYLSKDAGENWEGPREMPYFWMSNTMPTLKRLSDGRLLFLWNNTEPLPKEAVEVYPELWNGEKAGRLETVFTNRDIAHAAISEDGGKTWIGFREILLTEFRNDGDFRERQYDELRQEADMSVHQMEAIELPQNKVLVAVGQGKAARKLVMFDLKWLYETGRRDDFRGGLRNVSHHLYVKSLNGNERGWSGHCAFNRLPGAVMRREPETTRETKREALFLCRTKDDRLVNDRAGLAWNFPAARKGRLEIDCRIEGGEGFRFTLADHWFNASDEYAPLHSSMFTAPVRPDAFGTRVWKTLVCEWDADRVRLSVDGRTLTEKPMARSARFGASYLHIQMLADREDRDGVYFREFRQEKTP